jgi:hypothetical protein
MRAAWFALWALAGAGAALGLLTAATIGEFVLAGTAILTGLLAWRGDRLLAAPGVLAGMALVPLYVGYLNRGGPGDVCTTTATSQTCTQEMSPWPWLVAAVALAAACAGLAAGRAGRDRRRSGR